MFWPFLQRLRSVSAELNPIERVWKRTRHNWVHNAYFPTLQAPVDRVEQQFLGWSEPNEESTRLCQI
jgi:transposase